MADFGQLLSEWLEERLRETGMTATGLQKETGVARSTIDAILGEQRQADVATYQKLARALGVKSPPPLRQVVGGPMLPSDAQTPRQALSMARKAINAAERFLDRWPNRPTSKEALESLREDEDRLADLERDEGTGKRGA
jgi:transcriptional regulator with XRE-family HTH domain